MKLKRKFPWAAIVALALLCGVAGAAYAKSEGMQRFKPVPRVIFKLVMITEPSVPDGFVAWQDYLRERCTVKFGGKLIVQAGGRHISGNCPVKENQNTDRDCYL